MHHTTSRILSLLLVLVMVLSMVPTVFAAEDSISVTYVAENTTTGVQYESINDAIAAAQAGQTVKALADAEDVVYDTEGVILDLNGHDLSVTVAEGVTLSAIDSATDDYEGEYGSLTTDGTVATTVKTTGEVKSYVTIAENGSYTFHRYYASIAAISLKPTQVALGYRAEFRGDEAVKNAVTGYGYELWLNGGAHKTYSRTDALEKSSLTLRLKNIMSQGNDSLNTLGSTATIGGNAYITLTLNGEEVTLYGTEQETTLRQVVESVNANVSSYGEAQLQSVRDMITAYASWMEGWEVNAIFGNGEGEGDDTGLDVEITVDVTAENNILTQDATLSNDHITVTVPQGTTLEDGVTQLTLTITEKASSDSNISEEEGYTLLPLDVHIEGISADNTTPILVCLGEILPKGLNIGNYELYHVENGETVEMTHVLTLDELDTHNEFHYDPATGAVTVAMASFSEITLRANEENYWNGESDVSWYSEDSDSFEIYNADQLAGFGKLVDSGTTFEGKTVTMLSDINLHSEVLDKNGERISFNPIGYGYEFYSGKVFKGTFDGNGNTIYGLYQQGWDMEAVTGEDYTYSMAGGGLFASVVDATIKNLTVDGANIVMECVDMGVVVGYANGNCTFKNIIVRNSTIQNYNRATGGAIGEVGGGGTYILENVDVEATTTVSALWGTFDPSIGGIIGAKWGEAGTLAGKDTTALTVTMTDCDSAATLDVFNDVTSAYQWYSYRRCGMLIGYTEESKTVNGRTEATASFLTTENCTVQYGDWANYHYCEFTYTTSMDARYPWVRVEAGLSQGAYANARYGVPAFTDSVLDTSDAHIDNKDCHNDTDGHYVSIPFNQLYGGGQGCYGGNEHIEQNKGVTVITNIEPATKFTAKVDAGHQILTGSTVKLGDLFAAANGVDITDSGVYVFVSPATEGDTVRGSFVPSANTDWEDMTLTLTGEGTAKITITDYFYCINTTLVVDVVTPVVRCWDYNSVSSVDCESGSVTLPTADAEDGKTFIGWSETEIATTTEAPTILTAGSTYQPTKAIVDLYAVYSYESNAVTYTLVTDASELEAGDKLIIVSSSNGFVAGEINNSIMANVSVKIEDNKISSLPEGAVVLTLGGTADAWTLANDSGALLGATAAKKVAWDSGTTTWSISINDSGDATIQNGTNTYGRFLYNVSSPRFTTYTSNTSSSMLLPQLYKENSSSGSETVTCYVSASFTCEHENNTTTTTIEATCTTEGLKTVTCDDCREVVSEETISVIAHNYVDGTCDMCGDKKAGEWVLVTNVNQLTIGDKIVIVAAESDVALSTTQNSNNRGQASITKGDGTVEINESVQVLILENGTTNSTYAFNTGDGYLYAASSSSNYLRTQATNDANGSWAITIDANGIATVKAQGSNTHNTICYNSTNSIFSAYSNLQQDISIYRYAIYCSHNYDYEEVTIAPSCTEAGYSYKVCSNCNTQYDIIEGEAATGHSYEEEVTTAATCTEDGVKTFTCGACGDSYVEAIEATGHNYVDGICSVCGAEESTSTVPTVVLEITMDDFNTTSYAANNSTHTDGDYSFTSNQVMQQSSTMQWQKSSGYITIASNEFVKLELKVTAGTYTVTVGGTTVTGTTVDGVTTYDLTGLTGEIKISVGSATGKTEYLKFYK